MADSGYRHTPSGPPARPRGSSGPSSCSSRVAMVGRCGRDTPVCPERTRSGWIRSMRSFRSGASSSRCPGWPPTSYGVGGYRGSASSSRQCPLNEHRYCARPYSMSAVRWDLYIDHKREDHVVRSSIRCVRTASVLGALVLSLGAMTQYVPSAQAYEIVVSRKVSARGFSKGFPHPWGAAVGSLLPGHDPVRKG